MPRVVCRCVTGGPKTSSPQSERGASPGSRDFEAGRYTFSAVSSADVFKQRNKSACMCICVLNAGTDLHMYMYTHILTYTHAYIRTCMHTYTHIHTHTYIHTYIHT